MTRAEFYDEALLRMMQGIISDPNCSANLTAEKMAEVASHYAKALLDRRDRSGVPEANKAYTL